jgi:hypothetical protein
VHTLNKKGVNVQPQPLSQHQLTLGQSTQLHSKIPKLEIGVEQEEDSSQGVQQSSSDPDLWQVKSELDAVIAQLSSLEQQQLARKLYFKIKEVGLDLQKINLSTHLPEAMSARDVSQLAAYAYQFHSDIFQAVFLEKPQLLNRLSDGLVIAIIGIMATKWLR